MKQITIDNRKIGENQPPYIIAEISGNHNGCYERAIKLIELAKVNNADAVKLQSYTPDSITVNSSDEEFQIMSGLWEGYNLYQLYEKTQTPYEWLPSLFDKARELNITIFSSPYDNDSVDMLEELNCPAYKIASNEFTDYMLLERVIKTNKPIILSTGTATIEDITQTVNFLNNAGCKEYALLHCVSAYPAPISSMNLKVINDLQNRFDVPIGLSDHSLGNIAAINAVALGANILEKHFTLDRGDGGPDSVFSIEPDELRELSEACINTFNSLGVVDYGIKSVEKKSPIFKRHFYARSDLKKGDVLSDSNIKSVRARKGIEAMKYKEVIGMKASIDIPKNHPIEWDMLQRDII